MIEPNNKIMQADMRLHDMCEAIKDHIDTLPQDNTIATSTLDGVEIGYRVREFATYIRREIFIKTPGNDIGEISTEERERIMTAVFDVFLIPGARLPEITQIAFDCLRLQQDAIPMIQVERSPGLVSIAGGFHA